MHARLAQKWYDCNVINRASDIAQEGASITTFDRLILLATATAVVFLAREARRIVVEDDADRRAWQRAMREWENPSMAISTSGWVEG